jgi:2-hydroxychromene-2-carboxylate isomerase
VPFREPHGRLELDPDLFSRACVVARRNGAAELYARSLFSAIFAEDLARVDGDLCVELAGRIGLSRSAFATDLDRDETRAEQKRILHQALAHGAFGVPSFVQDGRLWWGNDRLVLLRHYLRQRAPVRS